MRFKLKRTVGLHHTGWVKSPKCRIKNNFVVTTLRNSVEPNCYLMLLKTTDFPNFKIMKPWENIKNVITSF